MSQYAQVIVDVPTTETDQPYTYLVPDEWQAVIECGCVWRCLLVKAIDIFKAS